MFSRVGIIVAEMVLGVLAAIITKWFSRRREFRADIGGVELAEKGNMIAALRRLQSVHEPENLPGELAAFGISSGVKSGLQKLLMSHPPLERRIAALENS